MRRSNPVFNTIRRVILVILAFYLLFTFLAFGIYIAVDPNTSTIELVKTVFELSLWLSIPVLLILVLLRGWRLALGALFVVILFGVIYVPQLLPRTPEVVVDTPRLTMMTFNLKGTSEGIAAVVSATDADIVAFQELSESGAAALQSLESAYPHQALHPQADDNIGQGILSRYPIEADAYWEYPAVPHTLGHQRVEIDFNGTPIVLYNTHPWPPLGWETGYNDESHRVVVQDIAARTFAEELPLILAGDFNMTANFEEYDLLATHFTDSYRVAGDGIGYTFPNIRYEPLPAFLRLDYIWHSDHFQSVAAVVWPDQAQSDHAPVVATLAFVDAMNNSSSEG